MEVPMEDFLRKYKIVEKTVKPTYIQIAGFPRWENVWSNIICFFLNNKYHEMNGFLINCFQKCLNDFPELGNVHIAEREVYTESGKRIDILVETENYCFFIENKIDASLNNDLDDYLMYCKNRSEINQKEHFGVVLGREEAKNVGNIYYINYKELLVHIRGNINKILFSSENKYLLYFIDFIETVSKVMEGNMGLDLDFYKLYMNEDGKVKNILKRHSELKDYRLSLVRKYVEFLRRNFEHMVSNQNHIHPYKPEGSDVTTTAVFHMKSFNNSSHLIVSIICSLENLIISIKKLNSQEDKILESIIGKSPEYFHSENNEFHSNGVYKLDESDKFENKYFEKVKEIVEEYYDLMQKTNNA
jgi:hypothetical protein